MRAIEQRQGGGAMISVLFIVVIMSFLVLAIAETAARAAERQFAARTRSELYWFAVGVEELAEAALAEATSGEGSALTANNPIFGQVFQVPLDAGAAELAFADATKCFNVNSFSRRGESGRDEANAQAQAALVAFGESVGLGPSDLQGVVAAIADWIDSDAAQEPRGAEDGYYSVLPTPYRTGGAPLVDVSEIRAVAGVDAQLYSLLRPVLCARSEDALASINLNLLTPADAPLLAALLGDVADVSAAQEIIASLPPGGYASMDEFWASPAVEALPRGEDENSELRSEVGDALAVTSR
ncbi:MAG: type II secretion system minor pseudopilin GspK, partial [Pseudomonadota bacterium]